MTDFCVIHARTDIFKTSTCFQMLMDNVSSLLRKIVLIKQLNININIYTHKHIHTCSCINLRYVIFCNAVFSSILQNDHGNKLPTRIYIMFSFIRKKKSFLQIKK